MFAVGRAVSHSGIPYWRRSYTNTPSKPSRSEYLKNAPIDVICTHGAQDHCILNAKEHSSTTPVTQPSSSNAKTDGRTMLFIGSLGMITNGTFAYYALCDPLVMYSNAELGVLGIFNIMMTSIYMLFRGK